MPIAKNGRHLTVHRFIFSFSFDKIAVFCLRITPNWLCKEFSMASELIFFSSAHSMSLSPHIFRYSPVELLCHRKRQKIESFFFALCRFQQADFWWRSTKCAVKVLLPIVFSLIFFAKNWIVSVDCCSFFDVKRWWSNGTSKYVNRDGAFLFSQASAQNNDKL